MKASNRNASKRAVNLTLSESLVDEAKSLTENLSGVVESLLAEFVAHERNQRLLNGKAVEATVAMWNKFNTQCGSIGDEYSSL